MCTPRALAPLRQPPHHRVVPHDPARRMVQPGLNRQPRTVRDVQPGNHLRALPRVEQLRPHAHEVVRAGRHPERAHRRLAVPQVEGAAVEEHEVEVEFVGQHGPEPQSLLVEAHVLGGALVRAHDRRVPPGPAEADVLRLEDRHVADAVVARQVVRGREAVHAAADDDGVVAALERGGTPEPAELEPVHRGRRKI